MPPKRPRDGEIPTNAQSKKQRIELARTIRVQSSSSTAPQKPLAGPSKSVQFVDSMVGLPSSIDVEKFVEARAYEVTAMQEAMENVSELSGTRVWQSLPRHLRRRAASHDVRRVPARLRERARTEMDPPKKKQARKRIPQAGKAKKLGRTEDFLLRQKNKTWLETHIWHAKRMKMEDMWGYRLAVQPTEKSFRPSHRASLHGSILHDASYDAIIELTGTEHALKLVLDQCCDTQGPSAGAARYTGGSRLCRTHMYGLDAYPFDLIAPIDILWRPSPPNPAEKASSEKGKGKAKAAPSIKANGRTIWIRCHPISYEKVSAVLRASISSVLQNLRDKDKEETLEVEIADLRDKFNIFEIMGPKSSQVIAGALSPIKDEMKGDFKKTWQALGQLRTSGSVPIGTVVGLKVHDPRLNFPPKNVTILESPSSENQIVWPSASLASCELWDEAKRNQLEKPRFKKKDIDDRKSKNLIPGTPLRASHKDDQIPIMLIQRTIASPASPSSSSSSSTLRALHGWTVIVPRGWGMPFFAALTHTGTRVGGQREAASQHFEAGSPHFPRDYPGTAGYDAFARARGEEERERWERKPPAKRASWAKLGSRSPWVPDWEVVLGLREASAVNGDAKALVPAQREAEVQVEEGAAAVEESRAQPWLLKGPETPSLVARLTHVPSAPAELLASISALRASRRLPASTVNADRLLEGALLPVLLHVPRSGAPAEGAVLYELGDGEAGRWKAMLDGPVDSAVETELSEVQPSQASIVGYVTSGNFSLSIGQGQAIGAIPVSVFLRITEQSHRLGFGGARPLVKMRNKDENICRVAELEILC